MRTAFHTLVTWAAAIATLGTANRTHHASGGFSRPALACGVLMGALGLAHADGVRGYYRQPELHGDTMVFVAEGDLWKSHVDGGVATRLTSHPGDESHPAISPDGQTVAFVAAYEGVDELYTMPLSGGLPTRRTFQGSDPEYVGWTPRGEVLYATREHSTLPNAQLVALTLEGQRGSARLLPLAQAAQGAYDDDARALFFTRFAFQGSHTKRYKGGTAQNLWRFAEGDAEATPLTGDYAGTSRDPMWWRGRVYFASDRDGTMNVWSMTPDGGDPRQHTHHSGFDVLGPSLHNGRVAYQLGADLYVLDLATGASRSIPITLDSDFDQTRESWVKSPWEYVTAVHASATGDRVVLTARGQVFVAPHRQGRLVEATRRPGVRYRQARFMPDGKSLVALSDESGEVELWRLPANGVGAAEQLTHGADVLRWDLLPSPDGRLIAHHDKNQRLHLLEVESRENRVIDESPVDNFADLAWSPDSRFLAYVVTMDNLFRVVRIYSVEDRTHFDASTDRYDTYSPAWSPDGKWLYVLSDRNLASVVASPWGNYQPEPFLDRKTRIYQIALTRDLRSPFAPRDELADRPAAAESAASQPQSSAAQPQSDTSQPASTSGVRVAIERDGVATRIIEVAVPAGNYGNLAVNDKALFWLSSPAGESKNTLQAVAISNENIEVKTVLADVASFELTPDGKKLLLRKGEALYIVDANADAAALDRKDVNLAGWTMSVTPREEWRQMFIEAWRLERDYFYDPAMHGVDWPEMRDKYLPLVDRVSTRAELSDLVAQMVAELAALHIFVRGGAQREGPDHVAVAALGARLLRDEVAAGYRVEHIYLSDPDEPQRTSPLARPGVDVHAGDVIEAINGVPALSVAHPALLLRQKAGRQVLLRVRPAGGAAPRDVVVTPIGPDDEADLRYHEWEYTRRQMVEELGRGQIGYVHLRAMGGGNFSEWARSFYPVFTRQGLIVDVRHNRGGNIDSWIIGRLLRKAWFYWSQRVGASPAWNMQYAFRGHVVVLCDERTASDGEAFCEGIKRLGIGTVIGTRTWGGEIWLSASNFLVDHGIATAAESGVYGPAGEWLIEGHGVEPHVVVDNLPHATFKGEDAQLKAAIAHLQKLIAERPVPPASQPAYPVKRFNYPAGAR
ncbi:MAG: Tricorn protease [Phycisphaerae bacterium]|nr:Tricorn protease [Phycisphaerae bacterium]